MAKRSQRNPAQPGKYNTGFMRAFISMLNFREGHFTPKLLTKGSHGKGGEHQRVELDLLTCPNDKHDKVIYNNSISESANMGKVSVKALMEEEMSHRILKKNIQNSQIKFKVSDYENEANLHRNEKQITKKCKVTSDVNINNFTAPTSLGKSFPNDLAAFLAQFYNYTSKNQEMHIYSNNMVSLSSALRTICDKIHSHLDETDSSLGQKQLKVRKALIDIAEAISSQAFVEKQLVGRRHIKSQELVDALEVLHSNKDLLIKLIIDPESLLLENAQEFQKSCEAKHSKVELDRFSENIQVLEEEDNVSSENHEDSNSIALLNPRKSSPFWEENRPKEAKVSTETYSSQSLNRIVLLKPNLPKNQNSSIMTVTSSAPHSHHYTRHEKEGKRFVSFFSLTEIKRKLKHVFFENRKKRNAVSMDGVFDRIPIGRKDPMDVKKEIANEAVLMSSTKRSSNNNEKVSETLVNSRGKSKKNPGECALSINDDVVSSTAGYSIYKEGKRHLIEMLDAGVQTDSLPADQITKSLGKLLCLPEYSFSPISSPRRQAELCLSPKTTGFSISEQTMIEDPAVLLRQNLEDTSCFSNNLNSEDILKTKNKDTRMHKILSITRELISAGSPEFVTEEDININQIPELLDSTIQGPEIEEPDTENNRTNEQIAPPSASGSSNNNSRRSILSEMSPRHSVTEKSFPAESIIEKPERSPVSVLEPFSMEDRLQIQPQKADFEDGDSSSGVLTVFNTDTNLRSPIDDNKANEAVSDSSDTKGNECLERYNLADQLLELSMICEEGSSCYLLRDDRKLLLDCIDEVLIKLQNKCSKGTSSVSFVKSSIQTPLTGKHLVHEVHKWIEGLVPNTLEERVKNDLNKGSWMDLGIAAEDLAIKICNSILDDLMEEYLVDFSCWPHFT